MIALIVVGVLAGLVLVALLAMLDRISCDSGSSSSSSKGCGRESTGASSSSGCGFGDDLADTRQCGVSPFGDNAGAVDCEDVVDNVQDPGETWYRVVAESIWPLRDVFDNQTAVALEAEGFKVRGLHWTTSRDAYPDWVQVYGGLQQRSVQVTAVYGDDTDGTATLRLSPGQPTYDHYLVHFPGCSGGASPFMDHVICPAAPQRLFPASAPQVLGVYRNSDTLFVVFSEVMDGETTRLGHGAIDLVFREGDAVHSVVSDLNLADFDSSLNGRVFAVAPITNRPFDLVVGGMVTGALGGALDVDRDGRPDPGRAFVHTVYPTLLDICRRRSDYPYPCISEAEAAVTKHQFDAPIPVSVPVP